MQYNGTIQYKVLSGGGLDGNGEPIISTVSWSEPIRCLYKTVKHSNTIYQQGKFKYILIRVEAGTYFSA